jgi:TonB family protein
VVKVTDDLRSKQVYKPESGNSNTANFQNFIQGRVTDQRNNPISNAALRIENTRNIYNTDQLGYFKIPATDSVVNVSVNVVGYQPQQFKLNNLNAAAGDNYLAANQLRLQANELPLSEVTVVGYGARKKQAAVASKYPSVMVQDAAPAYGWVLFEQYLQKNKKPPADNPLVTGEVVLSFTVNKKGELSDFTIEQSLAKGYDEEAIRLVKEGPAWTLQKGRKAKVTVIVRF